LLLLAVGSLPLLFLEVVANRLPNGDKRFLVAANVVVFVAFAIDYLVELAHKAEYLISQKCPSISSYAKSERTHLVHVRMTALVCTEPPLPH
jgi:hypothetical protein